MAVELAIADDFATIVDGAEPATLHRRGSAETIAVPKAWRYSAITAEAEAGISGVARHDVVWQFAWSDAVPLPRLGDTILDATGSSWTILSVEVRGANSRLRCTTRNLAIVDQLDDRIEIQQAVWDEGEITGWITTRSAVAARIQPERTNVDHDAEPPTSTATYRIVLADNTPLDQNHRLVGPDGTIYAIMEYTQADRFDALPVAQASRLASG